jgi:hypothetical protein
LHKLSTPLDLLRFSALPFVDRIRLGLLALRARRVQDWQTLEQRTASDWLRALGGDFEPVDSYGGRHIVYLSKYLPEDDPLYRMEDAAVVDFTLGHLARMFPDLRPDWVRAAHVWRARFSQPIVERGYAGLIPARDTPIAGLKLATMAQIYPEDRGTNYAVREGRVAATALVAELCAERAAGARGPASMA